MEYKMEMLNTYNARNAADAYVLGFTLDGWLYRIELAEIPAHMVGMTRMSSAKGGFRKIRVKLNKAAKLELIAMGAELMGPASLLEQDAAHNRGENFERLVAEAAGKTWVKDSVPFWVAGDLRVNGRELQIKLDGAELANERSLARAMA